jgi:hypothetical protein
MTPLPRHTRWIAFVGVEVEVAGSDEEAGDLGSRVDSATLVSLEDAEKVGSAVGSGILLLDPVVTAREEAAGGAADGDDDAANMDKDADRDAKLRLHWPPLSRSAEVPRQSRSKSYSHEKRPCCSL